jgi:hypothetical protein
MKTAEFTPFILKFRSVISFIVNLYSVKLGCKL